MRGYPMNIHQKNAAGLTSAGRKYKPQYRFTKWDAGIVVLVILITAGIAAWLFQTTKNSITEDSHLEAVLLVSGTEVWRTDLSDLTSPETYDVVVDEGGLTVLAEAGKVCIETSQCPDQICVHTGWLISAGQTAVCLPYKTVLKVVSVDGQGSITADTSALYDAISR